MAKVRCDDKGLYVLSDDHYKCRPMSETAFYDGGIAQADLSKGKKVTLVRYGRYSEVWNVCEYYNPGMKVYP